MPQDALAARNLHIRECEVRFNECEKVLIAAGLEIVVVPGGHYLAKAERVELGELENVEIRCIELDASDGVAVNRSAKSQHGFFIAVEFGSLLVDLRHHPLVDVHK